MNIDRNYTFDVLKFIFAISIALSHYSVNLPGVTIVVEFFFILSGFFLARKYYYNREKDICLSPYEYTLKHIKKLYLPYIFALIMVFLYPYIKSIMFLFIGKTPEYTMKEFFLQIYDLIPEALMLQNIGIFPGGINYPLWQVCVLIVVSHFIYTMLFVNDKITLNLICPLLVICNYTLFSSINDGWGKIGCFYVPLLRGIAPVCIGVILYKLVEKNYNCCNNKLYLFFFNIMGLISIIGILKLEGYHYIYLLLSCIIIFVVSLKNTWINIIFNKKEFKILGPLSYAIYLNHALIIKIFKDICYIIETRFGFLINNYLLKTIFVCVLLIYSVFTMRLVKFLELKLKKITLKYDNGNKAEQKKHS